ncbi:K P-type ATPase (mediates high-affinity potassium or sodium uptake) [Fusarium phyllophilum]|uniref:K P-type ATPase (Mediates high-affinity potassium or sodium uptake) n=1 Tax=Fusarium phyllophilum TaxID=47803 RepID=A0A8H5N1T2_9HYPO|nr:K P-type ATPase (mediates high-affinity potassium or sodium uptake) [Fusarium phyllophilum]
MDSFPFERLPIELKIEIIRYDIPSITVCLTRQYSQWSFVDDFIHVHEEELSRVRASSLEIKTLCDRLRYLVICTHGQELCRLDPLRDLFVIEEPWIGISGALQLPREQGPGSSQPAGPPIRRMLYRMGDPSIPRGAPATGKTLPEDEIETYARMPFGSSLPIWPRTPILKEFILTFAVCGPDWHIDSFQQYGPDVSPGDWQDTPWIGSHGYSSRRGLTRICKWPGFRYWTETGKIEFRPLSWPEVLPSVRVFQEDSAIVIPPEFTVRLWINRPGEPIDAEQSQYGWIEVKAPEEGDDPWVEQLATTWKMVRYLFWRSSGFMDFEWHLDNK